MSKTVLIVVAHPDPASLNGALKEIAISELRELGHRVLLSDLYGMGWKAPFDGGDFLDRRDPTRLSLVTESGHAYASGTQTPDVMAEQEKLAAADAVIFQFPLWWFSMPAILKGWVDRVFAYGLAYGYKNAGNQYRYGDGGFAGKRALLSTTVGGPAIDYSPRGINGPLEDLLFHITHGTLFFAGMTVLPTHAIYAVDRLEREAADDAFMRWRGRLRGLFTDAPIPFRHQNAGDYPDRHVLDESVAPGVRGFAAHVDTRVHTEGQPRGSET
ncbi:NAD(P)H-dependent oxidoreductase [Polyangium jinanense]|uniref:NAD(P)H-dependent oxidoreductase n=1 Tax=Polyangium jinanense TaxID=2829994 RepID=A0A9X4AV97_9BACT|nr:NAD(P)H-dependent oxidoreductase [Polyangium jinanense]MDC3958934.1 NAD(P)H-dependent oxidoreductase [Polyangium jinanense]MDC3986048.1 NAD(P)H-dependent oxidoreductase [Polyangium jinanense]